MNISALKLLDSGRLLNTQSVQNSEKIPMSGTVPANDKYQARVSISNYGDFLCMFITGSFETLYKVTVQQVDHIVDIGIDYMRGILGDSIGQRKLFTDYVPFSLWLTPGRRRSPDAENNLLDVANVANECPGSSFLFYPMEFEYVWAANAEIILDVYNDSNVEQDFDICFHGVRIASAQAVSGASSIRQSLR